MAENQNMNDLLFRNNQARNQWTWDASTAQRDWNDAQAMRQITYNNMMAQDRQGWDLQRLQWDTAQNEAAWRRTWDIWKNVDPELERYEKKKLREEVRAAEKKNNGPNAWEVATTIGKGIGAIAGLGLPTAIGGTLGGALMSNFIPKTS